MPRRMSAQAVSRQKGVQTGKKQRILQLPETHAVQLLTIDQVAARLSVHRTTVYDFINNLGLPVTRLAAHAVRVDEADLQVWIEKRKEAS